MIDRDGQNVKSKFVVPLAIVLSLLIIDGKLGSMSDGNMQGVSVYFK
jgi:hypothetical protein